RDQRAPLPVAQGDHGREGKAAGPRLARRPGSGGRRGGLRDRGARPVRPAAARRLAAHRGRRKRRAADPRLSRGAEAHLKSLVFLEHHEGELVKSSLGVLSKVASLGGDVAGVVAGSGVRELAPGAGEFGATKVYVADDPRLEAPLPQP